MFATTRIAAWDVAQRSLDVSASACSHALERAEGSRRIREAWRVKRSVPVRIVAAARCLFGRWSKATGSASTRSPISSVSIVLVLAMTAVLTLQPIGANAGAETRTTGRAGHVLLSAVSKLHVKAGSKHRITPSIPISPAPKQASPPIPRGRTSTDPPSTSQRVVRELTADRTAKSQTFLLASGERLVKLYAEPEFYRPKNSLFYVPINTSLTRSEADKNSLSTTQNSFTTTINPSNSAEGMIQIGIGGAELAMSPVGATGVTPIQSSGPNELNTATYSNLWSGVSAEYQVENQGIIENLEINSSSAQPEFQFSLQGATIVANSTTGGATVVMGGKQVATIPPPTVTPASGTADGADPSLTVFPSANGAIVQVGLNSTWLEQLPATDFPVDLDPTVLLTPSSTSAAFSVVSVPSSGSTVSGVLKVGQSSGVQWSAAIHWNYESYLDAYPQYQVVNAYIPAGEFSDQSGSCSCTTSLSIYPYNASLFPESGDLSPGEYGPLLSTQTDSGTISNSMNLMSAYSSWLSANQASMGVELFGSTTANTLKIYAANPYLDLTVEQPPAAETLTTPSAGATVATTTPTLSAPTEAPDDGNGVQYDFRISTSSDGSGQVIDTGWFPGTGTGISISGGTVSYVPPKGVLEDGVTYYAEILTTIEAGYVVPQQPSLTEFQINLRLGAGGPSPTDTVGSTPDGSSSPSAGSPSPGTPTASATVDMVDGNLSLGVGNHSLTTVSGPLEVSLAYNSLSQDGAGAVQSGAVGQYFTDSGSHVFSSSNLIGQRTDANLNFNWTTQPPVGGLDLGEAVLAQWTGYVDIPNPQVGGGCTGSASTGDCWTIGVASDGGMRVYLDGSSSTAVSNWSNSPVNTSNPTFSTANVSLTAGEHAVTIQAWEPASGYQIAQVSIHDFSVPSSGTNVGLAGWLSSTPSTLPSGWSLSPGGAGVQYVGLNDQGGTVAVEESDGSSLNFTASSGAAYIPPPGNQDLLSVIDGGYSLSTPNNQLYQFNPSGALVSVSSTSDDRSPSSLIYEYSGTPSVLVAVKDPVSGRSVTLDYGGVTNAIDGSVCPTPQSGYYFPQGFLCTINYWDSTQTVLSYDAPSNGRLVQVANPGSEVAQFGYDSASGLLNQIRDPLAYDAIAAGVAPNSSASDTNVSYSVGSTGAYQVASVTSPQAVPGSSVAAPERTYSYYPSASPAYTTVNIAGFSPAIGYAEKVTYDAKGEVTSQTQATGASTTTSSSAVWDNNGEPVVTVNAEGEQTTKVYNLVGLVTDVYGPSPVACFATASPYLPVSNPLTTPGCGVNPPHTQNSYDDQLTSLAASYWTNPYMSGSVNLHATGTGDTSADFQGTGADFPTSVENATGWSAQYSGTIDLTSTDDFGGFTYGFKIDTKQIASLYVGNVLIASASGTPSNGNGAYVQGSFPVGAVGPEPIRVVYVSTSNVAKKNAFGIEWLQPGTSKWKPILNTSLDPNYGLLTTSTDPDGDVTVTSYSDNGTGGDGIGPEFSLPTAVTQYPNGTSSPSTALTNTTTYETPGSGFLRKIATTLPAGDPTPGSPADGATADKTTYSYYGGTSGPIAAVCGLTSTTSQGGLESQKIEPASAAGQSPVTTQFVYNAAGQMVGDRTGTLAEIASVAWNCTTLDSRGRAVSQLFSAHGSSPARTITTTYSVAGNPLATSVTDGSTTIASVVDLLGRPISYSDNGIVTTSQYDQSGQLTQTVGPQGTIGNSYDPNNGQLSTVSLNGTTESTSHYNAATGQLSSVSYGNGTTLTTGYDFTGDESSISVVGSGGATIASDAVTRSPGGRITTEQMDTSTGVRNLNPSGGADYVFDGAGRLIQAYGLNGVTSYSYGANAPADSCANPNLGEDTNMTSQSTTAYSGGAISGQDYCYNTADQLVSEYSASGGVNSSSFAYDDEGNETQMGVTTLGWNSSGGDTSISASGSATITYTDDAVDRTQSRTEGSSIITYAYCGFTDGACATVNSSGTTLQGFLGLPGGASVTEQSTGAVWSYPDIGGAMIATANSAGALTSGPYVYSPYGLQESSGSPIQNAGTDTSYGAFGGAGNLTDTGSATGANAIVQMGARPYVPNLGRFLSVDPVQGGCSNAYVYVRGDPLDQSDDSGQTTCYSFSGIYASVNGVTISPGEQGIDRDGDGGVSVSVGGTLSTGGQVVIGPTVAAMLAKETLSQQTQAICSAFHDKQGDIPPYISECRAAVEDLSFSNDLYLAGFGHNFLILGFSSDLESAVDVSIQSVGYIPCQ